jgi:hypothetical protein
MEKRTKRFASANGVEKIVTLHPVTVDSVYVGMDGNRKIQKNGTLTAQLKQTVDTKSIYPTKSVVNSLQDNIFGAEAFNFEKKEYENTSVRTAWIDVPETHTLESVKAQLENFPDACIHQILSNKPILTTQQEYAIKNGIVTLDTIANRQVVRQRQGATDAEGNDISNEIILDNHGKPFYRANYFRTSYKEDVDYRTEDANDFYVSEAIEMELAGNTSSIFGN